LRWSSITWKPVGIHQIDKNLVLPPSLDQEEVLGISLNDDAKTTKQAPTPYRVR
jgi:hypothetical protein